jgi:hypothetical protein
VTRELLTKGRPGNAGSASRAPASPGPATAAVAAQMLGLQRSVGNRVVVAQSGRIQAKLMVGSAYDPAERQADEVAHAVMRQLGGASAHEPEEMAEGGATTLRRAVLAPVGMDAPIGVDGGELSSDVASTIQSERGRGQALPDPVRAPFERAFATDLSGVRVHNDSRSSELNRAVSAKAFTIGSDIFLGAGQYRPNSRDGQQLLAHEVTHTIQQGG